MYKEREIEIKRKQNNKAQSIECDMNAHMTSIAMYDSMYVYMDRFIVLKVICQKKSINFGLIFTQTQDTYAGLTNADSYSQQI